MYILTTIIKHYNLKRVKIMPNKDSFVPSNKALIVADAIEILRAHGFQVNSVNIPPNGLVTLGLWLPGTFDKLSEKRKCNFQSELLAPLNHPRQKS